MSRIKPSRSLWNRFITLTLLFIGCIVLILKQDSVPSSSDTITPGNNPQVLDLSPAQRRRLEFLHIPKTGGTAIEIAAAHHGIVWSLCHFTKPSNTILHCPPASGKYSRPPIAKYGNCPSWHVPVQFFTGEAIAENTSIPPSPYKDADIFVVVRNPYDRIVSEYYYIMSHIRRKPANITNSVSYFNNFISSRLHATSLAHDSMHEPTGQSMDTWRAIYPPIHFISSALVISFHSTTMCLIIVGGWSSMC